MMDGNMWSDIVCVKQINQIYVFTRCADVKLVYLTYATRQILIKKLFIVCVIKQLFLSRGKVR